MSRYYDSLLEGGKIKELLKILFEKSGYTVYPYGYETVFADVRKKLHTKDARNSKTSRRIRSSPDLLVFDEAHKDVHLVEVKMRRARSEAKVMIYAEKIEAYKQFWDDSILVVVVPCGNVFYAQRVSDLETKDSYDVGRDFKKLVEIFPKVKEEDVRHYRDDALKIMRK